VSVGADVALAELNDEARESTCEACGSMGMVAFHLVEGAPTQTCVLLDDRDVAAAYPTGDVLLAFCSVCGFIQNVRFDPRLIDYSQPTEESQSFSGRFTEFAAWLADEMVRRFQLHGKTVLEVGCGKGDFLHLLAEREIAGGIGIDPGFLPERGPGSSGKLEFRREFFGPSSTGLTADFVYTRHFLEHIPNVGEMLRWLSEAAAASGASLFNEVPDVARILAEGAYWDVFYEHCSYFTIGSLARAMRDAGLGIEWLEPGFGDQYLLAAGSPSLAADVTHPAEDDVAEIAALVSSFPAKAAESVEHWRRTIDPVHQTGGSIAIWGGASKTVSFLASLKLSDVTVVDINPFKQGKWLPGTAIEVESPVALTMKRPDLVIAMNKVYASEIRADLMRMGLDPRLLSV
jgi:hypothetical protein